ncbi:MAG: hypothetical protein Q4F34_09210, partial [Prevotellaceae bacterium]|nr:hypothetical protein [Prevotellaceae bacterium]
MVVVKQDVLKDAGSGPTDDQKNLIVDTNGNFKPVPSETSTNPTKAEYDAAYAAYTAYHDASNYKRYRHDDPNHNIMSYAHWYETTPHWYDADQKDIDHQ